MRQRVTATTLKVREAPAGADTMQRLQRGQEVESHGESWSHEWQYVEAGGVRGWASALYLEPAPAPAPAKRPLYTLAGEDPELTERIDKLAASALAEGIEFTTADFGGVRTEADTTKILKYRDDDYSVYVRNLKAKSPNAKPVPIRTWRPINAFGTSKHNYGCARDLRITTRPASFSESAAMARVGKLATQLGLVWGGNFRRVDTPHVELAITIAQARKRWEARRRLVA